jgi:hypothetical protein
MNPSCQITIKGKFLPSNLNGIIVKKLKLYKVPIEGSRLDGEAGWQVTLQIIFANWD